MNSKVYSTFLTLIILFSASAFAGRSDSGSSGKSSPAITAPESKNIPDSEACRSAIDNSVKFIFSTQSCEVIGEDQGFSELRCQVIKSGKVTQSIRNVFLPKEVAKKSDSAELKAALMGPAGHFGLMKIKRSQCEQHTSGLHGFDATIESPKAAQ